MKKVFIIILISISFLSCNKEQTDKYESIYEIIDELLRFNNYDVGVVVQELTKVSTPTSYIIDSNGDTIIGNFPPPPGIVPYDKSWLFFLYKINLIDSLEIDYMFNQIDTLEPYTLDSTRIIKKTVSESELMKLFNQNGIDSTYHILSNKYGNPCFIQFSIPLISKDGNKLIMDADSHCGGLSGGGIRYLFEKINGKWRIIYCRGTWVS